MSGSKRTHPNKEAMDLVAMDKGIVKLMEAIVGTVADMEAVQHLFRALVLLSNQALPAHPVQQITVPRWPNTTEAKTRKLFSLVIL